MRRFFAGCVISLAACVLAWGHDSPAHRVEALTARMEMEGPRADLLMDRAFEYNALGDWPLAIADFEAALRLSPDSWVALQGCAEAYVKLGEWEPVVSLARKGLVSQESPASKAPFYALLAQALMEQKQWNAALEAWTGALKSPSPEIDWYLGQSDTLASLGDHEQQVAALAAARQRNPSVVLHREWLRALVNAGKYDQALTEINYELTHARWKSTWLLLRARIYRALKQEAAQSADAKEALEEIKLRFRPNRPDPHLVKEMDQALAFLQQ